jgi:hypothetical protein
LSYRENKKSLMIIRDITIKELPAFINSELYKGSRMVPVTPERAVSQSKNPRAQPDDVVLIVAYTEDGQLAGFAGMLPDTGTSAKGPYRFAWNSGWWVDKELGKGIALDLFLRSIDAWKEQYMITDLTPRTRKIIELTHLFYFAAPARGIRLQILSDFSGKLRRNYKSLLIFSGMFTVIDAIFNSILRLRHSLWLKKTKTEGLKIEYIQDLENDSLSFIERHSQGELCHRGKKEFSWIISYPWIVAEASGLKKNLYPFSWECRNFEYSWAKILYREEIAGIVLLTHKDGLVKIPYAYYEPGQLNLFSYAVCRILLDRKAAGFYTVRGELMDFLEKNNFPVFYKKPVAQDLAVSKTLSDRQPEKFFLQDGDGDGVFT